MEGIANSYSGSTLVVTMDTNNGTGTHADWNLNVAGNVGAPGAPGPAGSGSGNVNGPVSSTNGYIPTWNGATGTALNAGVAAPIGGIVGTTDTQALTNKAIDGLASTTLNNLDTRTVSVSDLAPVSGDSGLILVINPATAIHLTRVFCAVPGSTNVVMNLDKRAESTIGTDSGAHLLASDLTAVPGGANTVIFANGAGQCGGTSSCAIAAHAPVMMTFTSLSGTPTALNCSVDYTVD